MFSQAMALSKTSSSGYDTVTKEEIHLVRSILRRMQAQGINLEEDSVSVPAGAMTDASKRLRESDDESIQALADELEFETGDFVDVEAMKAAFRKEKPETQKPLVPKLGKPVPLPSGITSLEKWGKNICELPKVKHLKASYEELAADPDWTSYMEWVLSHGHEMGARCLDLQSYLKATNWSKPVPKGQLTYAGSSHVRQFKA